MHYTNPIYMHFKATVLIVTYDLILTLFDNILRIYNTFCLWKHHVN
jgi:hypothetical protein